MTVTLSKNDAIGLSLIITAGLWVLSDTLGLETFSDVSIVIGLFLLLPLIYFFGAGLPFVEDDSQDQTDPIDELRERYRQGLLDDAEFERRLSHLLETQSLEEEYDQFGPEEWDHDWEEADTAVDTE